MSNDLHRERDGAASLFYPGMRSPGVVACAHDDRFLLGLVAFVASKRTSMLVASCHCNEVNRRPPRSIRRHVSPLEAKVSSDLAAKQVSQREGHPMNLAARSPATRATKSGPPDNVFHEEGRRGLGEVPAAMRRPCIPLPYTF